MSINTYLKWLFLLVLAFGEGAMAFAQMQTLDQATEAKLLINKAELALIVDDLSLAKQYYEKVLAQNSPLLTKDINNILVVAAELQDSELGCAI